jgi:hypothetical protein
LKSNWKQIRITNDNLPVFLDCKSSGNQMTIIINILFKSIQIQNFKGYCDFHEVKLKSFSQIF